MRPHLERARVVLPREFSVPLEAALRQSGGELAGEYASDGFAGAVSGRVEAGRVRLRLAMAAEGATIGLKRWPHLLGLRGAGRPRSHGVVFLETSRTNRPMWR